MIVNDGRADRPNRDLIFGSEFKVAGVSTGPHTKSALFFVVNLVGGYNEKTEWKKAAVIPPGYPWKKENLDITFMEFGCDITEFTDLVTNLKIKCKLP
jgi:hypothetical protein